MVDTKKYYETIKQENKLHVNYPWLERDVWQPRLEALGDNEDDIIEFMDNADKEALEGLWPVYDDIMDKFPSDKMDKAIDRFLDKYKKTFNVNF